MAFDAKSEVPRIIEALSKVHGEPYAPADPLNQEPNYQLGYVRGLQGETNNLPDGITTEWKRRGRPDTVDDSFRNWKRGYWAGRFIAASR